MWTRNCSEGSVAPGSLAWICDDQPEMGESAILAKYNIEDMYDCHVINLARHQRHKQFCQQNETAGLPIEQIEAIDGSTVDPARTITIVTTGAKYTPDKRFRHVVR